MRIIFGVLFCCLLVANTSFAQSNWEDYTDERSRMKFNTNDPDEKDVIAGDLDRDGDTDIVIVRKVEFSNPGARDNLLIMNEGGNLVDRTDDFISNFSGDDRDVQLFDSNNDGWLDIVTVTTFGDSPRLYLNNGNDSNGNWQGYTEKEDWYAPEFNPGPKFCGVGIGDVNGDNLNDLFFVDYDNGLENRLLINNGDDTYTDETNSRLSFDATEVGFGTGAFITDFNYDGFNDIVSLESTVEGGGNGEGFGIEFCINDGTGHFNDVQVLPSILTYMHELADFNGDGRNDLYVISDIQDYIIFNNSTNGDGTINVTTQNVTNSNRTSGFGGNVHAIDADNDGDIDMAVCDVDVDIPGCSRVFCTLRNDGSGGLSDPNNSLNLPWNVSGSHDCCWIDVNRDGYQDLFIATCDDYHMFVNDRPFVLCDVNLDGSADLLDVAPFIDLIGSGGYLAQADTNSDGEINLLDVAGFIDCLAP